MGFFKKISKMLSGSGSTGGDAIWIAVQCSRCGEVIRTRINLYNDLSIDYGEAGGATYYCRKELIGEGTAERPCFQRVAVELTFDANRRLTGREISGGKFLDEEE